MEEHGRELDHYNVTSSVIEVSSFYVAQLNRKVNHKSILNINSYTDAQYTNPGERYFTEIYAIENISDVACIKITKKK
jgi:hypothetical protein